MHVNKPKDQDLDMQLPSSTSPLLWLSQTNRTSKKLFTSPFPTGPCKNQNSHLSLLSFSLKESARKLSWVFLQAFSIQTDQIWTNQYVMNSYVMLLIMRELFCLNALWKVKALMKRSFWWKENLFIKDKSFWSSVVL